MEQRITVVGDFDGTLPAGELAREDNLEFFPPGPTGGLFDFELEAPVWVRTIELHLYEIKGFTLHKRDREGTEILILFGGNNPDTDIITTLADSFVLTAKQVLVLRTDTSEDTMTARVTIQSPV